MPEVNQSTLDAFVAESDRLGGPGAPDCETYWSQFSYTPTYQVDQSLDPMSEAYVNEQLALHRELSNRQFDQNVNELSVFDLASHTASVNPYNHPGPGALGVHAQRLGKAFRLARIARGAHLLDMGCGWGLSSEIAAYLGMRVTGVDINPQFVELVNRRAARSGWPIKAVLSDFDSYRAVEPADAILFYECFHHAVRPWTLLRTMADALDHRHGVLMLAGEPINDIWWTHWGLRLDALSIYCMRKFGWFESGWSMPFVEDMFRNCGLSIEVHADADPEIGFTVFGRRAAPTVRYSISEVLAAGPSEGWVMEQEAAVLTGPGFLEIAFPNNVERAYVEFSNHRGAAVSLRATTGETVWIDRQIAAGQSSFRVDRLSDRVRIDLDGETWNPATELGNADDRQISLHFTGISFA